VTATVIEVQFGRPDEPPARPSVPPAILENGAARVVHALLEGQLETLDAMADEFERMAAELRKQVAAARKLITYLDPDVPLPTSGDRA
jgi:hypothetical protein